MKHLEDFEDYYSIKNIMSRVVEGLNSPMKVEWQKSPDEWEGKFAIEHIQYIILIKNFSENGHWLFKFKTLEKDYELLHDLKKAFSSIPTIEKAAIDFIEEKDPEVLVFCAADKSEGRKKLYTKYSQEISNKFKMISYIEKKDKQSLYINHKKDYDGVELTISLAKMVRWMNSDGH